MYPAYTYEWDSPSIEQQEVVLVVGPQHLQKHHNLTLDFDVVTLFPLIYFYGSRIKRRSFQVKCISHTHFDRLSL